MGLFSGEGTEFLLRWGHFLAGITWIGLLYYFNFVQGAYFAEADAKAKSDATQKLVPRALWWFRWGAMFTFLTGFSIILLKGHNLGHEVYLTSWGVMILTGALLGICMFLNVWLIIWPNQKIVIASAKQTAGGGQAIPEAAACATRASVASRTNTLFSVPMLFFMAAASHLPVSLSGATLMPMWLVILAIVGALELNAVVGKTGPITTIKGVITSGFILTAVLYGVVCVLA
jgi:uncharacterized membrane protein